MRRGPGNDTGGVTDQQVAVPGRGTSAFGKLLRGSRDRSDAAGATGRRSSGLRREDVASRAGISVDYLIQLEQGRATNPSAPVVAALARALTLDQEQAALLHRSAGLAAPASVLDRTVPEGV